MQDANLQVTEKTLSHILLHVVCLHFLRIHHDYFFRRGFESVRAQFLSVNILVIYLFNYDVVFMLNVAFDVILSAVFCQVNWNSLVSGQFPLENSHPENSHLSNSPLENSHPSNSPLENPPRKTPTQKTPTRNVPTHIFKHFVFSLLLPLSLIMVKRLYFCLLKMLKT